MIFSIFMKKRLYKNIFVVLLNFILVFNLYACKNVETKETLYVYNWGIYLDESVIGKFEDKYNVKVIYDTYDTNEEMFAVINSGGRVYDVLCPTDYMIEKMINQNLLYSYDLTTLKNYENIDKRIFKIIQSFDKNNTYVIPYVHSTLGLIYNKTILDEKNLPYPKSWSDLWYEGYKKEIFMQDAMRDLLMVGLKKNNFSMNTTNQNELDIATADLIKQKPLVNAYMIDTLRDKMVSGEGAISVMYSGEVEYITTEGKKYEYEYILPTEGVNFTIDAWVIPQNSQNKELAKKWIDFMLEPDIALLNYDYMHYGISNLSAIELIKERDGESAVENEAIFPNLDDVDKYEIYKDLGDFEDKYDDAYKLIKSKGV